jgi:hypothetical protein
MLETYWKNVDPSRQHERYGAKPKAKKAKATEGESSQTKSSPAKKRRSAAADEDSQDVPVKASQSRRKSGVSATNGESKAQSNGTETLPEAKKESKRARSSEVNSSQPAKKQKSRPSGAEDELASAPTTGEKNDQTEELQVQIQEDDHGSNASADVAQSLLNGDLDGTEEVEEDKDDLVDGYNEDRPRSDNDEKYADRDSWEVRPTVRLYSTCINRVMRTQDVVEYLDTVEIKAPDGVVLDDDDDGKRYLYVMVIW